MKKLALFRLFALGLLGLSTSVRAEDVKITGEASCAKCALNLTSECQNAITVTGKDGKKEVILVEPNALAKAFHQVICQDAANVKAEGVVAEKNGQKVITLTKIEEAK
jgi:hypothetical protein